MFKLLQKKKEIFWITLRVEGNNDIKMQIRKAQCYKEYTIQICKTKKMLRILFCAQILFIKRTTSIIHRTCNLCFTQLLNCFYASSNLEGSLQANVLKMHNSLVGIFETSHSSTFLTASYRTFHTLLLFPLFKPLDSSLISMFYGRVCV